MGTRMTYIVISHCFCIKTADADAKLNGNKKKKEWRTHIYQKCSLKLYTDHWFDFHMFHRILQQGD